MGAGIFCFCPALCFLSGHHCTYILVSSEIVIGFLPPGEFSSASWLRSLAFIHHYPGRPCLAATVYFLWSGPIQTLFAYSTVGSFGYFPWNYFNTGNQRVASLALPFGGSGADQWRVQFCLPLAGVTSYPFSLGWSEGNRLWDYSVLFGSSLYDYPADKPIPVLLDIGRQIMGGIPFLFPRTTIWQARLWIALINVVPYLILGWIAFRFSKKYFLHWVLAGIWAFTFVRQGPIHPPLLVSAIIVALAWGRSLWIAIPLIIMSSYFAEVSRFTWMFAPGMWAGMLELGGGVYQNGHPDGKAWTRAISVGLAGTLWWLFYSQIIPQP